MSLLLSNLESESIFSLEMKLSEYEVNDPREAAEIAYAIAFYYYQKGCLEKAKQFGLRSIALFKSSGKTRTEEECLPIHSVIGGIVMPEIIHEQVVAFRMDRFWKIEV